MTNQEAKEILLLYRPGISESDESEFAEALACVRQDLELRRWFEEHCAFQTVLRSKIREIPVPDGLKEQIISERQVRTAFPNKRTALAASACLLLLLVLSVIAFQFWPRREDATFTNFQSRMIRSVARGYPKMDIETNDPKQIRAVLAQKGGPDYVLPPRFDKVAYTGAAVIPWQGKSVSMVCFNSGKNKTTAPDLFLFVINNADAPRAPTATTPKFGQRSGLSIASWTKGDKTYLLAGQEDEAALRNYF